MGLWATFECSANTEAKSTSKFFTITQASLRIACTLHNFITLPLLSWVVWRPMQDVSYTENMSLYDRKIHTPTVLLAFLLMIWATSSSNSWLMACNYALESLHFPRKHIHAFTQVSCNVACFVAPKAIRRELLMFVGSWLERGDILYHESSHSPINSCNKVHKELNYVKYCL